MQLKHTPFVLIILDGWGYRENANYNAINTAKTPHWNQWWQHYPHTLIQGSGECVGLPAGQMGNSEVGHLTIGAGRVVYQDFTRIEKAIKEGEFFENAVLISALQKAKSENKTVHILGLVSPGGVHSHEHQIHAMIELAAKHQIDDLCVHAFLDGRDTPPKSAMQSLDALEKHCKTLGCGRIASLVGRYYAMDRDKRWDRTARAYELLTEGKANYHAISAGIALNMAYERGETDEFVNPTLIYDSQQPIATITDGDVVIFMNFRTDRTRQLTRAFTDEAFTGFGRHKFPKLSELVTLTRYAADIHASVAFPPIKLQNTLGEYLAGLGVHQLRIAETEKYAHVTFFFNGGIEPPFPGEDRILIPSPRVSTYDLHPEMSAPQIAEELVKAIHRGKHSVIICNFANPDMLGHTGDFSATVKAIECIDRCLNQIVQALQKVGGEAIITADHGNAECMFDECTQQAHTAHTSEPVPLLYIGRKAQFDNVDGTLSDIAPTILYLLGLPQPKEMTGRNLLTV